MRGARSVVAMLAAAMLLVCAAQPAFGFVLVERSGRAGAWSVADSSTQALLRCTYEDGDLATLTVAPPQMKSRVRGRRLVSWEFQVWRAKWWMAIPDHWYVVHSSDMATAIATRKRAAEFGPREWAVPADFRTAYDSFKVGLVLRWFGRDGLTQIGQRTVELEYYELDGSVLGPGHCRGSQLPSEAPPASPPAQVPGGFVLMSHWRPYWKKFSQEKVQATIDELTRMNQPAVILTGLQSGNEYALPPDVASYLGMFRDVAIAPYLALWVGRFSDAETDNAVRAWEAGDGQWAGIVLDVERGLERQMEIDPVAAVAAVDRFMARVQPLTPFFATSTFGVLSDHPDMPWSELNAYSDIWMPQVYFRGDEEALFLLDRMQASIDYESALWSEPPKPVVPVVNDWGNGVDLVELENYIEIAFARYGAVSGWRLHPNMHEPVKDLWGTFPR